MFYIDASYLSDEKYDPALFMPYLTDNYDVLNSYFMDNVSKLPIRTTYKIVVDAYQPDLISYNIYKTEFFWEWLLYYNNITDFSQLSTGVVLNCFSLTDLEELFYSLTAKQAST